MRRFLTRRAHLSAWLLAGGFLAILAGGALGIGFGGAMLQAENRRSAAAPAWPDSLAALRALPAAAEAWVADRFGFRDPLLRAHARLAFLLRARAARERVLIGQEGWLFFGDEASRISWQRLSPPDAAEQARWRAFWLARREAAAAIGAGYLFVAVPDKHSVYPERMPADPPVLGGASRMQLLRAVGQAALGPGYLDLTVALTAAGAGPARHYRTDTHWTPFGAWLGYRAIEARLAALGLAPRGLPPLPPEPFPSMEFSGGDLARILAVDLVETAPGRPVLPGPCDGATQPLSLGRFDAILPWPLRRGGCPDGRLRALLLHDSFGDALYPYLSAGFAEVTMIPIRAPLPLFRDLLEAVRPDVVIEQRVERLLDFRFDERGR